MIIKTRAINESSNKNENLSASLNLLGQAGIKPKNTKDSTSKDKDSLKEALTSSKQKTKKEEDSKNNEESKKSSQFNKIDEKNKRVLTNIKAQGRVSFDVRNTNEFYFGEYDRLNFAYTGQGVNYHRGKSIYNGTFRQNKKWGIGVFYENKTGNISHYYRGQWKNNLENGFGIYFKNDTEERKKVLQEGVFENGIFKKGLQITTTNDLETKELTINKYYGMILNKEYHGQGRLYRKTLQKSEIDKKYEVKEIYEFEGNFIKNLPEGLGVCKKEKPLSKYKEEYQGKFVNGMQNDDYGEITFGEGFYLKSYKGGFENDKYFCHYGKVEFASGDSYEGFFDKEQRKSKVGLYYHYDKKERKAAEHFFGEFYNDRKHGFGKFIMKEGSMCVGNYVDGEKNGNFELLSIINEVGVKNDYKPRSLAGKKKEDENKDKKARKKKYFLFENDEPIDTSDKPIKY